MIFQYAAAYGGRNVWQFLIDYGFVDGLLPFLLIFVLVFAILQRIGIFTTPGAAGAPAEPDRAINGILAMVLAAMVVVPHMVGLYPARMDPVILMNLFLPHTAVLLLVILCIMLLLGLAGGEIPSLFTWAIALGAVGLLGFLIFMALVPGWFPTFDFLREPWLQATLITLLTLGLVGYFLFRRPTAPGFGAWIRDWLGPPPP